MMSLSLVNYRPKGEKHLKLKRALLEASVSMDYSVLRLRVFGERQRNWGKGGEKGAMLEKYECTHQNSDAFL